MQNLPPDSFKQIQEAICRPEGTFTLNYESPDLFDKQKLGGIILDIPSGQHLFRLERDNNLCVHFYHSSPGTGTRVATIDLNKVPTAPAVFLTFSWAPNETKLHLKIPEARTTLLQHIVSRGAINFQNYGNCKRAFNKVYGIKFGDLSVSSNTLRDLQSYIRYRHRIVHVSPSISMLNQGNVPPEEPVFPKKEIAENAIDCFSDFIDQLHKSTLELRH